MKVVRDQAYEAALLRRRIEYVSRLKEALQKENSIAAAAVRELTAIVDGEVSGDGEVAQACLSGRSDCRAEAVGRFLASQGIESMRHQRRDSGGCRGFHTGSGAAWRGEGRMVGSALCAPLALWLFATPATAQLLPRMQDALSRASTCELGQVLPPLPQLPVKVGSDVFGNTVPPVALDQVACPNCNRKIAAGRFAPHLDKCMGRARAASRIAQERVSAMDM